MRVVSVVPVPSARPVDSFFPTTMKVEKTLHKRNGHIYEDLIVLRTIV